MAPPLNPTMAVDVGTTKLSPKAAAGAGAASASASASASGSEEELKHMIDERKQRRMLSNRESARRSRMRKQQHLDELRAEAAHLRTQNNHILTKLNVTSHKYLQMHEENDKLKSYATELNLKLQSLNMILQWAGLLNGLDLSSTSTASEFQLDPNPPLLSPIDFKLSYLSPVAMAAAEIYQ